MAQASLNWHVDNGVMILSGDLNRETLMPLWDERQTFIPSDVHSLDVSGLEYVDSPGLAMLIYLLDGTSARERPVALVGLTEKLRALMALYNLQQIIQPYLMSQSEGL